MSLTKRACKIQKDTLKLMLGSALTQGPGRCRLLCALLMYRLMKAGHTRVCVSATYSRALQVALEWKLEMKGLRKVGNADPGSLPKLSVDDGY